MKINYKRITSLFLCAALLFTAAGSAFAAKTNTEENSCSVRVLPFEEIYNAIASFFHRILNLFRMTNEMKIPKPSPLPDKTEPAADIPEIDPSAPVISAETWRCAEIAFEAENGYEDPFSDVTLDLILIGDGRQRTVPCFWDGGGIWKARVACPKAGTWYYKTVCSDDTDAGLHNKTGAIECAEYAGDLDVYRHGFPTTAAGKKYFTYADGTPFFYLGDTHWSLGDETADMVREIAEKRASQG
nr:DUF5060 domain-containing protein [Clostridia bacterium]